MQIEALPVIARLKALFVRLANSNIYVYALVRFYLCRWRPFLPHEIDFAAVPLLPISDQEIFLDVGANDGLSALSFRVFNKTTPILSIEANPNHRAMLERVKRRLKAFEYMMVGAGSEDSFLTLFTPSYKNISLTSYASLSMESARNNLAENVHIAGIAEKVVFSSAIVPVRRLDGLDLRPGFIKIDVEGSESVVLRGLGETLARHKPSVMVEYNPRNFSAVRDWLEGLGYEAFVYDARHRKFVEHAGDRTLNVFFLHPARLKPQPMPLP